MYVSLDSAKLARKEDQIEQLLVEREERERRSLEDEEIKEAEAKLELRPFKKFPACIYCS